MNDSTHLMRYLLGELSEDEQTALEEQYVADPRIFDTVAKVENDLVDDYVRGKLPPESRERFERMYLAHPHRRERVRFAEALLARVDASDSSTVPGAAPAARIAWRSWADRLLRPKPALGFAFATLLLASGVWLVFEARRTRQDAVQREAARTDQERRETETAARTGTGHGTADRPAAARPPAVVVLALEVGSVRAVDTASPTPLIIPPSATEVRLQLTMQERDYPTYRAILRRIGGAEILRRGPLTPEVAGTAATITLSVPATEFVPGDYMLTLEGATSGGAFEDVSRSLIRADQR